MAAGVGGMDLVLLVIAADEGVMPQTEEHLAILRLLGVEHFIVVLNKCDLTDEEWTDMVEEQIREELADLLPEATEALVRNCGRIGGTAALAAAAVGGMLAAFLIDSFIPGAGKGENKAMFRVGIFSMLALLLHNLPEGIAVFVGGCADLRIGLSLSVAIALHNIPEGISVALPIAASTGRRSQGVAAATLSGLSEPAGAVLAYLFLAPLFGEVLLATIFALVAGLMLYVVFDELLPAALAGRCPGWALVGILTGILVMLLSIAIV